MTCFEHLVDENLSILSHEKDIYTRVLKESPEGSLAYENYRGEIRYLHFLPQGKDASGKCKYQRRRITRNPDLLNALATKEYARVALKIIENNLAVLTNAKNTLLPMDPGSIKEGMHKTYRTLPDHCFEPIRRAKETERWQHEWAEKPYHQSTYREYEKTKTTTRGLRVRSRAELLIAEQLYKYDIPFRYEQVMTVGKYELAPDFTFLDKDGNEFYWEYCGMMADPGYEDTYLWKRKMYEGIGLCEWTNMIYSFDDGDSIDMREVEAIIRTKILPRMGVA